MFRFTRFGLQNQHHVRARNSVAPDLGQNATLFAEVGLHAQDGNIQAATEKAREIALEGAHPLTDNGYKVGMAKALVQRGLLASV
ncbi:MAG: hypothetical protein ACM3TN_02550 [Alphaproteobacteria bacterium]